MTLLTTIFLLATTLTRAELIDRMRATPLTRVNGLVQVVGNCPADMRREYQSPVASFVSDICRKLYHARREDPKKFSEPAIVVYVGDVRTNRTDVLTRLRQRGDGSVYTRITVPAPGFADRDQLRREVVKAFYLAVANDVLDDEQADRYYRASNPNLRLMDRYADLANWETGHPTEQSNDEFYLQMTRKIFKPGVAFPSDVLRFASRLYFYPDVFSVPLCGKYHSCTYREAIDQAPQDLRIRLMAFTKIQDIILLGGGRGDSLSAAASAYADFLRALAAYQKTPEELHKLLDVAEDKLKLAFEEACQRAERMQQ